MFGVSAKEAIKDFEKIKPKEMPTFEPWFTGHRACQAAAKCWPCARR